MGSALLKLVPAQNQVNENLVMHLEAILADAKSGKVTGMAGISFRRGGATGLSLIGSCSDDAEKTSGALRRLIRKIDSLSDEADG